MKTLMRGRGNIKKSERSEVVPVFRMVFYHALQVFQVSIHRLLERFIPGFLRRPLDKVGLCQNEFVVFAFHPDRKEHENRYVRHHGQKVRSHGYTYLLAEKRCFDLPLIFTLDAVP